MSGLCVWYFCVYLVLVIPLEWHEQHIIRDLVPTHTQEVVLHHLQHHNSPVPTPTHMTYNQHKRPAAAQAVAHKCTHIHIYVCICDCDCACLSYGDEVDLLPHVEGTHGHGATLTHCRSRRGHWGSSSSSRHRGLVHQRIDRHSHRHSGGTAGRHRQGLGRRRRVHPDTRHTQARSVPSGPVRARAAWTSHTGHSHSATIQAPGKWSIRPLETYGTAACQASV